MTESKKDIEEYIKKEIKKSGFPLENKSSMILSKLGWGVIPHMMFFNEKRQCDSEIDLLAFKRIEGTELGLAFNFLIIECKKQEKKAWVFFEEHACKPNTMATTILAQPKEVYTWLEKNFKNHYYYGQKPCSFHFPAFVKSGKPDVIAEAINQVLDALIFIFEQDGHEYPINRFYYPIIILDGRLFSARFGANENVKVTESKYLQLRVSRGLKKPEVTKVEDVRSIVQYVKSFIIDIVRIDFLEEFLKNFLTKRFEDARDLVS